MSEDETKQDGSEADVGSGNAADPTPSSQHKQGSTLTPPTDGGEVNGHKWVRRGTIAAWVLIGLTIVLAVVSGFHMYLNSRLEALKSSIVLECSERDAAVRAEYSEDALAFQTWKQVTEGNIQSTREGIIALTGVVDKTTLPVYPPNASEESKRDLRAARRSELISAQCIMAGGKPGFGSCPELLELYKGLGLTLPEDNQTKQP